MKQYLLSVHHDRGPARPVRGRDPADVQGRRRGQRRDSRPTGAWVFGGGLHPPATATVVRITDGEVVTTDGPFAETKEQLGGFWVIKAADLDAALAWGAKATRACQAPVEVRPFQDDPEV